jgi:spore coat protein U-like protein
MAAMDSNVGYGGEAVKSGRACNSCLFALLTHFSTVVLDKIYNYRLLSAMPLRRIDFCPVWIGVLVLALFCGAVPGRAASISTTFNVTATVQASCGVTAADLDFGAYMPGSDAANDTTIDVTCTNGTAYTIALDGGSVAHDVTARQMSDSGSNRLSYELYTDSSFATVWGDGTLATATISGTGNGAAQPATVYGRVPAGQYVPATNYADQITVKVTY